MTEEILMLVNRRKLNNGYKVLMINHFVNTIKEKC